jgi:DNA polymerase I
MAKKDYYDTLGVDENATTEEIKKAYRKKAMEHHPDRNNGSKKSEEKFKKIAEAYEILVDPMKRQQYDGKGKTGSGNGNSGGGSGNVPPKKPIFGEFYSIGSDGRLYINDAQLIDFWEKAGWRWVRIGGGKHLVRIQNNIINFSDTGEIIRFVRQWIKSLSYHLGYGINRNMLCNQVIANSRYLFEKVRFEYIKEEGIHFIQDTKDVCYFFYRNCVVKVTKSGVAVIPYDKLNGLVWGHRIKDRNFIAIEVKPLESEIERLLFNISGQDKGRYRSLITLIGYILHSYKDPGNAIAIILLDEKVGETGTANGGTGKGMISMIFYHTRSTVILLGKNFTAKRIFAFQRVETGTQVLVLQDVDSNENFENFYNLITDGITVEQKYKGEIYIPFEESPKFFITANNVMKAPTGHSTDRRKKEFEVSDWYGPARSPKDEFGHSLYNDWDEAEWNRFDNVVVKYAQFYLKFGIIDPPKINIESRRIMREVGEEFVEFMEDKLLEGVTKFNKKGIHEEFTKAYPDLRIYYRSPNKTTKKMKQFFVFKGIPFDEYPTATKKYIIIEPDKNNIPANGAPTATVPPPSDVPAGTNAPLTIHDVAHQYKVVKTAEDRKALIAELTKQKCFALDTETTGLDYSTLDIKGLSIAFKPHEAYYIPLPEDTDKAKKILAEFAPVFANTAIEKVLHNYKFDAQVLKKYSIHIGGKVFDTMLASYLCNPDGKRHGLKLVTLERLNYKQIEYTDLFSYNDKYKSIHDIPLQQLAEYAAEDADFTLQLKPLLEKELKDKGLMNLFTKVEVPLAMVLGDMEAEGIKVDAQALRELNMEAIAEMKVLAEKIYSLAGETFNIDSPRQLSKILFEKLCIEPTGDKTESGQHSTAADALDKIKDSHAIVPLIILYNKISSLSSTFMEKLPTQVNPFTDRVHTHLNQTVASTGRLSSSDPNLQAIPKQAHGYGQHIRKAFVPRDENHVLVAADFSQIELRIAAHYSEDATLIEAYRKGEDIHTITAAKVYGVPVEDITKDDYRRKAAKAVSFGIIYGMSAFTLAQRLTRDTGKPVTESEAKEVIESYFATYPGIKKYKETAIFNAVSKGYAETLMGRKRFLPNVNSYDPAKRRQAERNAVNTPIQGSSADIIKVAMINIHRELAERKLSSRLVLSVHDELLLDVPKDELQTVLALVKDKMENAVTLKVPLVVDIKHGNNWYEAH